MTVHHMFQEGDEHTSFCGQADTQGEVAAAAEKIQAIARRLKSPTSAIVATGMVRRMLLAEIEISMPPEHVKDLLSQEEEILKAFMVEVVPKSKGDA